jgi:hypothetical protein
MSARRVIDTATLRELLTYDANTGEFTWRVATRNGKGQPGRRAGALNSQGYRQISFDGRQLKAHRLAWLYVYGSWPQGDLDHVNGDQTDNRIDNLRPATRQQNCANSRPRRANKSGFKGVHLHRRTGKWRAVIRSRHLGLFKTPEEAHSAYCVAARNLFGEFWRAA